MGTETELYSAVETVLVARKWAGDAGNDYVFARKVGDATKSTSVVRTAKVVEELIKLGAARTPAAVIYPGDVDADPDEPAFLRVSFSVFVAISPMSTDPTGHISTFGGHKTEGAGSSAGRGVVEVAQEVVDATRLLDRDNSAVIVCYHTNTQEPYMPELTESANPLAVRQIDFIAEV